MRRFFQALVYTALVTLSSSCTTVWSANTENSEPARQSELVVVARVLGLVDRKPEAQTRRHREVHLIQVERTLKGYEMTGQQLAVRPNSLTWEYGRSYLFFLNPALPVSSMTQAVLPQPILQATEANIDAVVAIVAAQGGTVSPRLVLWITEDSGFGVVRKLTVAETGEFRWRRNTQGLPAELAGTLAKSATDMLRSVISETETSIPPDDAAIVVFNWLSADLVVHSKTFAADSPHTVALLHRVEQLLGIN